MASRDLNNFLVIVFHKDPFGTATSGLRVVTNMGGDVLTKYPGPSTREYSALPETLRDELGRREQPGDVESPRYDPLLALGLRRSFVGVLNGYLERQFAKLGIHPVAIEGQPEPMVACPCCGHQSLSERGQYEVCKVCFGEDNGSNDLDRMNGPNHMTLREARENFRRLGAISEQARTHVLPDGREHYSRAHG